jgi:hypothetical protein
MATADDILVKVYRIVRDPGRTATTQALALTILSHAQRAVNVFSRSVVSTVVLNTVANTTLYAVPSSLARVDLIRDGTKEIPKMTLPQLWARDKNWLTTTDTSFLAWSRLGRGVIAVIPAKTGASSVNLVGPSNLADLAAIGSTISVRDDQMDSLTELTEAIFTLRLRLFPAFQAVMQRLSDKYSIAPTKIFAPGVMPTDSSERIAGVAPGDIPDLEAINLQISMQRPGAPADKKR